MAVVLGLNAKAYHNTSSYESPSWNEIANIRDLTLSVEKGEADVSTRGGNGWEEIVATLKRASVQFQMVWDTADADFIAFRDAFLNNTLIDCWILDGDNATSGNQGLRAAFEVMSFNRNEQLTEGLTVDVTIKPGRGSNAPAWQTV